MKSRLMVPLAFFGLISCSEHVQSDESKTTTVAEIEVNSTDNFFGAYKISDSLFGAETTMKIDGELRVMTTNSLPNHTTGVFPNPDNPNTISVQNLTYKFPLKPRYTGKMQMVKEPGVALNGIKFDPGTAEVIICEDDKRYRIEAIQETMSLGLDENNAHVQPFGAYHYHGISQKLVELYDRGEDLVHIGFAKDGFAIYYSKSGKYASSYKLDSLLRSGLACIYTNPRYNSEVVIQDTDPDGTYSSDWVYYSGLGDLDECNGIEINGEYVYLLTDEYPFIGRCLMGDFVDDRPQGPPPGAGGKGHGHPGGGPPHNH